MERIEILVDILRDQIRKGAPRESVLWTLGMIRNEVLQMASAAQETVAPVGEDNRRSVQDADASGADAWMKALEPLDNQSGQRSSEVQASPMQKSDLESSNAKPMASAKSPVQSGSMVEVNQVIAIPAASLNDTLRQDESDLAHHLRPEVLLDLRQAVGINDRFRYISELFQGDAALFDQAIGVLNDISDFTEAIEWIDRFLLVARNWNPEDALVRQFYGLLRSRFV